MKLRHSLLLVLACLLISAPVIAQDPVTITLWSEFNNEELLVHLQETLVAPFEAANPGIHLEIVNQVGMEDLLRTAVLGGTAPDVLYTSGPAWNAEYIEAGYMEPLNGYSEQYGWADKLLPWAYATGTVNGTLYSIPLTYESIVMFYNKTLFEQQGWEVPTNRAEFEAVAAAAIEAGIHPLSYGNGGQIFANGHLISAYLNNYVLPADLRAALVGEKSWTDPVFAEAIALLTDDMAVKGWWSGGLENYYQYVGADYWTELANGEAAMMLVGSWGFNDAPQYFDLTENEWDWAPVPNMNAEPRELIFPLAIGSTLAINAASTHKDEVALLLDFLISNPEVVLSTAAGYNFGEWLLPLHFTLEDFPADTDPRVMRFHSELAAATAAGNFGYANWTFWPGPANNQLRTDISSVWEELTTVEDYLAAHQAVWEEVRATGATIPVP